MEHITVEQGAACLKDWFGCSSPAHTARGHAGPRVLIQRYGGNWKDQPGSSGRVPVHPDAREMVQRFDALVGHRYLYDGEELERRMREAGFAAIRRCSYGESSVADCRPRDAARFDADLEAVRP